MDFNKLVYHLGAAYSIVQSNADLLQGERSFLYTDEAGNSATIYFYIEGNTLELSSTPPTGTGFQMSAEVGQE